MSNDYFRDWGFSQAPFQQTAIAPDATGKTLLVGRDDEMRRLSMLLHSYPTITCIEGPNGVGKTSLVNVASFTAFDEYYRTKATLNKSTVEL